MSTSVECLWVIIPYFWNSDRNDYNNQDDTNSNRLMPDFSKEVHVNFYDKYISGSDNSKILICVDKWKIVYLILFLIF